MMQNNGDYYFGGMHIGWWILILIVVSVLVGGFRWFRKRQ